jgi:predicted aspartyl protease
MSQSAQSKDDWRLVASRWQQAIELMRSVPRSNQNYGQAQRKLTQYQRNLTVAQRQSNRSTAPRNPDGVVTLPPEFLPPRAVPRPVNPAPVRPSARPIAAVPQKNPALANSADRSQGTFFAPIIRRAGNTPVIRVTFNGSKQFDMILDTGASGTLITHRMASALGVVPVAETFVDTASQRNVSFPLGYVRSINVGGAVAQNVLVAIAGSDLTLGLLGHDFFGNYDITIRENEVEFRERG